MATQTPRRILVLCGTVGLAVSLAACGSSGGGTIAKAATASKSASASPSPSASASIAKTGTGTTTGTGSGTGTGTGTSGGGGGPTLSVSVTTKPTCSSGTNLVTYPGNPPVIAWSSTGTTNVTTSIDGPGLYGTFPPSGSNEFPFSCSGPDGSTATHTYTFKTIPGGVTRTVTLSATVHEITNVGGGSSASPSPGSGSPSASASP